MIIYYLIGSFFNFPDSQIRSADEMQISPKLIIPPGLFDACLSNELFVTEHTEKKCDEQIWNSRARIVIMH